MADILNPVTFYWKKYVEDRPLLGGLIFYGLLTVIIFPILGELVSSNDVFKALYSGRYLWWFGQFPHHSTFTFSPVLDFLARDSFNWLGNLILFGVFQTTGYTGLQLLRGLVVAAIVGLVHSLFDWNRNPIFLILLFFVITALGQKLLVRTALVAAPGLTVLLWIGVAGWDREDRTIYWLFPFVLLIWSQIHGSYQLGAGVLVVFLIGDLLDRIGRNREASLVSLVRVVGILTVTVLAVTFVKPYPDYSFVQRLTSSVGRIVPISDEGEKVPEDGSTKQRSTIGRPSTLSELSDEGDTQPTRPSQGNTGELAENDESSIDGERKSYYGLFKSTLQETVFPRKAFRSAEFDFPLDRLNFLFVRSALLLGGVGLLFLVFGVRNHVLAVLFPYLALGILGLGYLRTVGYLGIIPVLVLSANYRYHSWNLIRRPVIVTFMVSVVLVLGSVSFYVSVKGLGSRFSGNSNHEIGYGRHHERDPFVPRYVLENYLTQRFFNSYGLGSYLVWRWWPYKKVFIDTKMTAYAPGFQQKIVETPLPEILTNRNLHHALVEEGDHWDRYFPRTEEWSTIISQNQMAAYEKNPRTQRE